MPRDQIEDIAAAQSVALRAFSPVSPPLSIEIERHEEVGETLREYADRIERESATYRPLAAMAANEWVDAAARSGSRHPVDSLHERWRRRRDDRVRDLPLRSLCLSAFGFDPAKIHG